MTSPLMKELADNHPEACKLIVKILQDIDANKRNDDNCDDEIKETFSLSNMNELIGDVVDQVSRSDMTHVNADHALRVAWDFFVDFESSGQTLEQYSAASYE